MWQVEGPDDPTVVHYTQPGQTSAGESANFAVRAPFLGPVLDSAPCAWVPV